MDSVGHLPICVFFYTKIGKCLFFTYFDIIVL